MVIRFSEEEKRYIVYEKGNWHAKEDCPKSIRKELQKKLDLLEPSNKEAANK